MQARVYKISSSHAMFLPDNCSLLLQSLPLVFQPRGARTTDEHEFQMTGGPDTHTHLETFGLNDGENLFVQDRH